MLDIPPPKAPARIRPASPTDLDSLIEVFWAVAAEGRWLGTEVPFDRAGRRERFAATIASTDGTILLAIGTGGPGAGEAVVGFISVHVAPYGVANIGMGLLDGWRGRGIGRGLLGEAMAWAARAGAHKVALEVWPDNAPAHALYSKAGFVEEGRLLRHYRRRNGELWDSVLMGRPLP